ncbi:MAG TPA: NRAMP family divalent metal transporter [Terriglobales bacterium]|nr:NRAMP family divalent metal transporter [Terriglobales bacterium]
MTIERSLGFSRRLKTFLFVFGPAWIVMIADVDAPSIITAGESGAKFGYHMIFILLALIIPLFFIQEASGRLGLATGKGLAGVIRDNYSRRVAVFAALPMFVTDFLTYVAEYTGIAVGLGVLGISPFISLPIAFILHSTLVFTGSYKKTERILIGISAVLLLSYILDLILVKPDLTRVAASITPFQPYFQPSFAFMVAANVGAVIMPWMLFYQTGAVAEKGLKSVHERFERFETLLGAVVSEILMVVIVIVSDPLGQIDFLSPTSLANFLAPVAGRFALVLFGIGLAAAGFLALAVISLASTWGIAEALSWRARIGEKFSLARNFYVIYLVETLPAVLIPLFSKDLVKLMLDLMVVFVFVLAVPAILQGLISSNKQLMGRHVIKGWWRVIYWIMLSIVLLSGVLAIPTLLS